MQSLILKQLIWSTVCTAPVVIATCSMNVLQDQCPTLWLLIPQMKMTCDSSTYRCMYAYMTLVLTYVQYVHAYNKVMSKEFRHIQAKDRRQSPYSDKVRNNRKNSRYRHTKIHLLVSLGYTCAEHTHRRSKDTSMYRDSYRPFSPNLYRNSTDKQEENDQSLNRQELKCTNIYTYFSIIEQV